MDLPDTSVLIADEDDKSAGDLVCCFMKSRTVMSVLNRITMLPDWAGGMINLRSWLLLSGNHFIGLLGINSACVECILDMGWTITMVDHALAMAAGLTVTPPGQGIEVEV